LQGTIGGAQGTSVIDRRMDERIRPFQVNISNADVKDLRKRIQATRWPDKETVSDRSQGAPLDKLQELATYWGTKYNWRKADNEVDRGGHFAMWEYPELFAEELRKAFRSLRL